MVSLSKPSTIQLDAYLKISETLPFSYSKVGATQGDFPKGYDHDFSEIALGRGEAVWKLAKQAIREWKMFPGGWAFIYSDETPIGKDEVVAMSVSVMGVWWKNSCRIVYTFDEPNRFGFAYGTLTNHFEKGEEIFMVEKDEAGLVSYKIQAFSKPRLWLVKLAYPMARFFQRKFVKESKANMLAYVQTHLRNV